MEISRTEDDRFSNAKCVFALGPGEVQRLRTCVRGVAWRLILTNTKGTVQDKNTKNYMMGLCEPVF